MYGNWPREAGDPPTIRSSFSVGESEAKAPGGVNRLEGHHKEAAVPVCTHGEPPGKEEQWNCHYQG